MPKTVHYLCFYANQDNKDILISYPSVWSKIEYICEKIKNCGYNVDILSAAPIKRNGFYRGHVVQQKSGMKEIYLSSFKTKYSLFNKINLIYVYFQIICRLAAVKKDDIILVYHSMFYDRPIILLKKLFRKAFILEIEDVFSELSEKNHYMKARERKFFEQAQAYLCVNDLIADELKNQKKKVISYGRYDLPPLYQPKVELKTDIIDLVYAGVIEQQRGAAFLAADAMLYLDKRYRLHICGFGNETDLHALCNKIREHNADLRREAIVFHGMLEGEEYYRLLQDCQIALSTHRYNAENLSSADHTFPSKILVYLANGLRVAAQKLDCLQRSKVGNIIYYYDEPEPKNVAQAIERIKLDSPYRGREIMQSLDETFQKEMRCLLSSCVG